MEPPKDWAGRVGKGVAWGIVAAIVVAMIATAFEDEPHPTKCPPPAELAQPP